LRHYECIFLNPSDPILINQLVLQTVNGGIVAGVVGQTTRPVVTQVQVSQIYV